ncbi:MAG TPA: hypothetical protein QGH09_05815 [Vicinamibacterales bacterium]|jgi:hypothetical protein|nr:hypothetical protein [Vicinamibacterales bacterium]|tara:strand:- start:14396 stop:15256 length:861 start_codon:yes stop_codon:yes gene_type:complete
MQEEFSKLNQSHLSTLKEEGVLVLPDLISEQTIDLINKETSPWLEKIGFNHRTSSLIMGNNQWIEHLGICSLAALKFALDEQFINFLEDYFGTSVTLKSFSLQRKIFPEKGIRFHREIGEGLNVFLFLTNPSEKTGVTEFLKKSQNTEIEESYLLRNEVDDAIYMDVEKSPFKSKPLFQPTGGKGTLVIFHRGIWHRLPKFQAPGRTVLIMQYFQKDSPAKDHLVRNSFLQSLSDRQREVYLSNCSSASLPSLVELGSDPGHMGVYNIATWKKLAYFLRYKLLSKV